MIYLVILSIILSLISLYKSNEAKKDNLDTLKYLNKFTSANFRCHESMGKTLDLICKWIEKGGESDA